MAKKTPKLLTKKAKVNAEKNRISLLKNDHGEHFKLIFSHQIGKKYNFHAICTRDKEPVSGTNQLEVFRAFGKFMDACVHLTMTEVENIYRRKPDVHEGTYDPESGDDDVQVEHYCLFEKSDEPNPITDGVRLHGYVRTNGGYFVITKLDWYHEVNK